MAKKLKPSDIKILILDNNSSRQANFSSRLRVQGYNSKLLQGGFQALKILDQDKEKFNLIIVNGDLEDCAGLEVCSLIGDQQFEKKSKLPVLYFIDNGTQDSPLEVASLLKSGNIDIQKETSDFNKIFKLVKRNTNT